MKSYYVNIAATLGLGNLTNVKTGTERRKQLVTDCANGYIDATDAGNEEKRSAYMSALMLLFWGEVAKMQEKCKALRDLDYEDFVFKLYECLEVACSYRAWRTNAKTTAEACIRQVIASRGAAAILQTSNQLKHKDGINTVSLDTPVGDEDGRTLGDLVEDEGANFADRYDSASYLVQKYINENKIVESIFLDNMAYGDCMKTTKHTTKTVDEEGNESKSYSYSTEFWPFKIVQTVAGLDDSYYDYFKERYEVNELVLEKAKESLSKLSTTKLRKVLDKTISGARKDFAFLLQN